MKRRILAVFLAVSVLFLSGCNFILPLFSFDNPFTTTATTTLPSLVDGTISLNDDSYESFSLYQSPSYDLTDIEAYNNVLIETRDLIRRSNVQIVTSLYRQTAVIPGFGNTSTILIGTTSGSGVIYKADDTYYYAITNHHVIDDEGYIPVYEIQCFGDTESVVATVVFEDAALDLAVLRFAKGSRTEIHIMDITTRLYTKYTPGELVFAVGNPLSLANNVTFGEYLSREAIANATYLVIYHNATINEGSSGGALTDVDGALIGINTWGSETSDEQSFAIPVYVLYQFLVNNGLL